MPARPAIRLRPVEMLRPILDRLAPASTVFVMRATNVQVRMLRADLEAAGIDYRDDAGRVADFHSLRQTFINNLVRAGVHHKTAQDLVRDSTPVLTGRYTHGFKEDDLAAVNALPNLSGPVQERARATGTEDARPVDSVSAECLAPMGRFEGLSRDSDRLSASSEREAGAHEKPRKKPQNERSSRGESGHTSMGRGGFEPPTHGFSVRCSTN